MVNQKIIKQVLESLSVGDAMGMPTEFMTQKDILSQFSLVNEIIQPEHSRNHSNLTYASITDDTEQNIYLIMRYLKDGFISVENTAETLLNWVVECDAVNKRYIGPSSLKALRMIESGSDPYLSGTTGTTCGGIMRTPSLVLCSNIIDDQELFDNIVKGCIPTHNTSVALEVAVAYGFALREALLGKNIDSILQSAITFSRKANELAEYKICSASASRRIQELIKRIPSIHDDYQLLEELYYLYGTGLESIDTLTAVFGIFMYAKGDVFKSICMAASIGGDTDTIAALVGALQCAYAKGHNIPANIVMAVVENNRLNLDGLARSIVEKFLWKI